MKQHPAAEFDNDEGAKVDGPFFSFAHLAACFPHHETGNEGLALGYGFISPREEVLYETGILFKSFMKC